MFFCVSLCICAWNSLLETWTLTLAPHTSQHLYLCIFGFSLKEIFKLSKYLFPKVCGTLIVSCWLFSCSKNKIKGCYPLLSSAGYACEMHVKINKKLKRKPSKWFWVAEKKLYYKKVNNAHLHFVLSCNNKLL